MFIPKDQVEVILKNGKAKGLSGQAILDGLVTRGYEPEGVDIAQAKSEIVARTKPAEQPEGEGLGNKIVNTIKDIPGDVVETGKNFINSAQKRLDNIAEIRTALKNGDQGNLRSILQTVGQVAGIGADAIGETFKGAIKVALSPKDEQELKKVTSELGTEIANQPQVQGVVKWYNELNPKNKRDIDALGGVVNLVSNFVGGEAAGKAGNILKEGAIDTIDTTKSVISDATSAIVKKSSELKETAKGATDTILSKAKNLGEDIQAPSVSDATKVSLNPVEALKNTGQDIKVSVKGKLKNLSELTAEDKAVVQAETKQNLNNFTKQAELFKNDRSLPEGSPVESVGRRTDKALQIADGQRQKIGKTMGEIEQKYVGEKLPVSEDTLSKFAETIKNFENPKFGASNGNAPLVRKLVEDFDKLETSGATVGDRLEFIRAWENDLRDAKDAFGNFKENKTVYTRIQKAVGDLKKETVNHITEIDPEYKLLRKEYAQHLQLQKIGDQLLGKEGALGERIKGSATVKRAIQSNSDAGARQFLTKLKELTGYDSIKEADIALTAMESVGDYQGLSLLNILNEGKSGLAKKALEKLRNAAVGNDATRVKKYIDK